MSEYIPATEEVPLPPLDEEVIKQLALLGLDQMVVDVDDAKAEQFLAHVDRWLAEVKREAKNDAWHEGFSAGWDECDDPSGFVNDKWDAKTPSPYRQGETK